MIYLYRCRNCGNECELTEPDNDAGVCFECFEPGLTGHDSQGVTRNGGTTYHLMKRVWQVSIDRASLKRTTGM